MGFIVGLMFTGVFGLAQPGSTVMPVLRIDQGARQAAMGGAGVALADDASSIYWNPASLGQIQDNRYAFSHHQWFAGTKDELFHAALPSEQGALGLGLLYSGEPGIEYWSASNEPGDTFRTWDAVASAGYGLAVARGCYLGAAAKLFYQGLYTSAGYGGAVDLGFSFRPMTALILGAVGRNIGTAFYGQGPEQMPIEVGIGAGWHAGQVRAALDVVLPLDNSPALHMGAEYFAVPELALRLGYRTGTQDLATLGLLSGLTAGIGMTVGPLGIDYALTPYGKLGMAHRIGLHATLPRKGLGSLSVKVVDASDMRPIPADVSVTGILSESYHTGLAGKLELTRLPAGDLVIYTNRTGYVPRVDSMRIVGDRQQTAVIALSPLTYGNVTGTIYDAGTRKPIGGNIAYRSRVQGGVAVAPELGSYTFRDMPAGDYVVTASGPVADYVAQTCTLKVVPGQVVNKDFYLVKSRQTVVLQGVNFETGKADILPDFEPVLVRAGEILKASPGITVELAGHTDPREIATAEFPSNWELSQARAEAVRRFLVEKFGIASERLTAHGYADTQPLAPNDTDEGMARNRRTEFRVTGQ